MKIFHKIEKGYLKEKKGSVNPMKLTYIQYEVQKLCESLGSVLNMEIIISDCDFKKVGDTKKYFDDEVKVIKDTYVIGQVVRTSQPVVIERIEDSENCMNCPEIDKCHLKGMICNPIKYKDKTIGAIGLIATSEQYRLTLVENQLNLIEFLDRMGDLIVSKMLEKETSDKLKLMRSQLLSIMDSFDEGVVAIDENGTIIYKNSIAGEIFPFEAKDLMGREIYEILPKNYIKSLIKDNLQFSNIELKIDRDGKESHFLISSKLAELGDLNPGFILTFAKMDDVYKVINEVSLKNLPTFFDDIIGESIEIIQAKEKSKRVAKSNSTILILGESGTGKELFARAIHESSPRKDKPFIAVNSGAIPENLIESELFGYEEGAFTGAIRGGKIGKFQLAQGGTIFLDEIGDMPIHLQIKLLRVLEEGVIEKIGGHKSIPIDARVITATNRELEKMIETGEFREDLYYRLNVIPINIPPLRERTGDIKIIMDYFLKEYNRKLGKNIKGFSSSVEKILLNNQWRGNIREMKNIVEYSVNMETTSYITMNSIPRKIRTNCDNRLSHDRILPIKEMEKKLIQNALILYEDSVEGKKMVADALKISVATLYRKIKEYKI